MDLNARKREILAAVIKTYMETGEPVGSKVLSHILGNRLSSATLRNEMSELCDLGFLEQPHTSAGRAPTKEGYRFYIKKLMPAISPDRETTRQLDARILNLPEEPDLLLSAASAELSDFTGLPALSAVLENKQAALTQAGLIPTDPTSFLLTAMTSDGIHGSRICKTIWPLSEEQTALFRKIVQDQLFGCPVSELSPTVLQGLIASASDDGLVLAPLFITLFELAEHLTNAAFSVHGAENLYDFSELYMSARQILSLISHRDSLIALLGSAAAPVSVVFGEDCGIDALKPSGMVIASYHIGNSKIGRIGVIGPTRMNYSYLVPSIEYFAKGVEEKLKLRA